MLPNGIAVLGLAFRNGVRRCCDSHLSEAAAHFSPRPSLCDRRDQREFQRLIRCFGEVATDSWSNRRYDGTLWFDGRRSAESCVLARRAAGRSPRCEPWVTEPTPPSPGGATPSFDASHGTRQCHNGSAAPSGLLTLMSDSPTAHAVGYDLPPSGLKPTGSVRSRRKRRTSLGSDGQNFHLSKTPDEPFQIDSRPPSVA